MNKPHTSKSTNVRSYRLDAMRLSFAVLGRISPDTAAQFAERLFFTPRRFTRPAWETELAHKAARFRLQHGEHVIPAFSWGQGPTVLLVHGWEGRGTQLGAFVEPLVATGHRVLAIDFPGHGEAADARNSVVGFAESLSAVLPQIGPVHSIIGHSAGAAASVLAYTMAPFQSRLVLLAPPRGPRTFFDQFAQYMQLTRSTQQAFEERVRQRFGRTIDEIDVKNYGGAVPLPSLVIHDEHDKDVPLSHGRATAEALLDASLVVTQGLGHRRILRDPSVIERTVQFVLQSAQAIQSATYVAAQNSASLY